MGFETEFLSRVWRSKRYKPYMSVCRRFAVYLDSTLDKTFTVEGYDTFRCKPLVKEIGYYHRFTGDYRKMLYAKFSQLEDWYNEFHPPAYLMSLTTSNRGKTIKEAFDELRNGWRGLANTIRKMRLEKHTDYEYLYIYEPHKSGYPHMHVIIFGVLTDADIHRMKKLWSDKYGCGSYDHGLDVSMPEEDQHRIDDFEHIRAYILKYLQKGIDLDSMTLSDFVFNAVMWSFFDKSQWSYKIPYWTASGKFAPKSTGGGAFRLWGASRGLTAVMKEQLKVMDATHYGENWQRLGEQIPEVIKDISFGAMKRFLCENGE